MAPLYNTLFTNIFDKAIFRAKNYFYFGAKPKFINPIYYSRRLNEKNSEKEQCQCHTRPKNSDINGSQETTT